LLAPYHGHIKDVSNGASHCGVVATGFGL